MKTRWLFALLLVLGAGCLLIPDDQERGTPVPNKRPTVRITAGAATSDSAGVDYKVNFQWRGADNDGIVIRFQYAADDTTTESAWQDTTGFGTLLKLGASHLNPDLPAGSTSEGVFTDWHTFYIRAIDNEYAASQVDKRYFNARTIAPKTKITFPTITAGITPTFVNTFAIEWEGSDLDSSQPDKKPAFYEYKLILVPSDFLPDSVVTDSLRVSKNILLDSLAAGDKTRWSRVSGKVEELLLKDLSQTIGGEKFIFGVRAVDEAGAIEPVLDKSINWFKFAIGSVPSKPIVTVTEHVLGGHIFSGDIWGSRVKPVEVPANTEIRFKWVVDASSYGSRAGNVNYGMDVPDPEDDRYRDPRGIGGWIGWGKWAGVVNPLIFPDTEDGQYHIFYIRARDAGDQLAHEQLCTIVMKVVAFRFDKAVLLVDDAKIGYDNTSTDNQDAIHDAFVRKFVGQIAEYTPDGRFPSEQDQRSMYRQAGANKPPESKPPPDDAALTVGDVSHYTTMLYSFNAMPGVRGGIYLHERENKSRGDRRLLSSFVGAGGKLFLFGGRPLSCMINTEGNTGGDYPKLPPGIADETKSQFSEGSFVWKFLHVRNQVVGTKEGGCQGRHPLSRDGLVRCVSYNPAYPDLYLDPVKYDCLRKHNCGAPGGIADWEGVWEGSASEDDNPNGYTPKVADEGLDTLYTGVCYSWGEGPPSHLDGAVIAQRYESTAVDTLLGNAQGRVVLFLFQPYPFVEGPTIDAGTAAINWLMKGSDY